MADLIDKNSELGERKSIQVQNKPTTPFPAEFRFGSIETLVNQQDQQDQLSQTKSGKEHSLTIDWQQQTLHHQTKSWLAPVAPILVIDSAPSSPTTPTRTKRPCPLAVDALQRLDLLSPNYVPSSEFNAKMPVSPSYTTSDLGSSPRSSISTTHGQLGINATTWNSFRKLSSDDTESDCGGGKDLLSLRNMYSPAPFSPCSDCGIDLTAPSNSITPFSSRSPNQSPSPIHPADTLHFNFEQLRSQSSMSTHAEKAEKMVRQGLTPPRLFDKNVRERSRSEGEMIKKKSEDSGEGEGTEEMDTSICHSTNSVPATASSTAGHKRRLLQKTRKDHLALDDESEPRTPIAMPSQLNMHSAFSACFPNTSYSIGSSHQDSLGKSASQISRQPTIEEPPPSPTLAELFHPNVLDIERRKQVEEWIRQQSAALEAFRQSLVPPQQESTHLQVPNTISPQFLNQTSIAQLSKLGQLGLGIPGEAVPFLGPIRPISPHRAQQPWRRSRSESDVSRGVSTASSNASIIPTTSSANSPITPKQSVALNDAIHVCDFCGQGFSMHDRLAKHIASRHRDRSASMNDENSRIHKCTLCPKGFGRSDMLTRHMRLHTGVKPYSCQICGQVFSRSDHLSTHQRTHTGEKPYRCPHCSYSASRRDMITRHMRTHLQDESLSSMSSEFQIPSIDELSLATPKSLSPQPPQNRPPLPSTVLNPPISTKEQKQTATISTSQNLTEAGGETLPCPKPSIPLFAFQNPLFSDSIQEQQKILLSQLGCLTSPTTTNATLSTVTTATDEILAKILNTITTDASAFRSVNQPGFLPAFNQDEIDIASALLKHSTANLCRSTPNLSLGNVNEGSAFTPLFGGTSLTSPFLQQPKNPILTNESATLQALKQSFTLNIGGSNGTSQTQQLSANCLKSLTINNNNNSNMPPLLVRQSSIGGFGFNDSNNQQKPF